MEWGDWALNIFKLPRTLFPKVLDSAGDFGHVPEKLFGAKIPIFCSVSWGILWTHDSGIYEHLSMKFKKMKC